MAELDAWRKRSPKNEETFQQAMDPEKMWADLKALEDSRISRLEKKPMRGPAKKPSRSIIRRIGIGILKIAAILLLVLFTYIGVAIYRFKTLHSSAPDSEDHLAAVIDFSDITGNDPFNRGFLAGYAGLDIHTGSKGWLIGDVPETTRHAKDVYYRHFTSDGNHLKLNFSDSTHIWLNSNATIKYPSWQRTDSLHIYLNGEAYIHIPSGTKHVYEIKISPPVDNKKPSAFLEAVADKVSRSMYMFSNGGDFYVRAYFGRDATIATLISGSLRIDSVAGKSVTPVTLEPGQQAKLDSGNFQILKPERASELWGWKSQ
jgi:hypothetical protein